MLTAAAPGVSSTCAAAPAPVTAAAIAPTLVDEPEAAAAAATSGLVPVPGNSGAAVLLDPSCRVNQAVEQRTGTEEDIQSFAE